MLTAIHIIMDGYIIVFGRLNVFQSLIVKGIVGVFVCDADAESLSK